MMGVNSVPMAAVPASSSAQCREPGQVADAHRHGRGVGQSRPAEPGHRQQVGVLEGEARDQQRNAAQSHLPCGQGGRRHVDRAALAEHRTKGEQHGGAQGDRDAGKLGCAQAEAAAATHQQHDAADAQDECCHPGRSKPLAQHGPGEQGGPDWHRVGKRRRLTRLQPQHGKRGEPHPCRDVEHRRAREAAAAPVRHCQALAARRGYASQDQAGHDAGDAARRQRRALLQQQLGGRPVQPPAERGDHQAGDADQPGPAGQGGNRAAHRTISQRATRAASDRSLGERASVSLRNAVFHVIVGGTRASRWRLAWGMRRDGWSA